MTAGDKTTRELTNTKHESDILVTITETKILPVTIIVVIQSPNC